MSAMVLLCGRRRAATLLAAVLLGCTLAAGQGAATGRAEKPPPHLPPPPVEDLVDGMRFIRTTACADAGDSGAGVFRAGDNGRAEGIHSGSHLGIPCSQWNAPEDHWSVVGHLQFALKALDATLVTH